MILLKLPKIHRTKFLYILEIYVYWPSKVYKNKVFYLILLAIQETIVIVVKLPNLKKETNIAIEMITKITIKMKILMDSKIKLK